MRSSATARVALDEADVVLVSDYGRGITGHPDVRDALERRIGREVVWDPHPRGAPPVPGATRLVTPNESEAATMSGFRSPATCVDVTEQAQLLARRWGAGGVAVTLGARAHCSCRVTAPR